MTHSKKSLYEDWYVHSHFIWYLLNFQNNLINFYVKDATSDTSRERPGSRSGSERSKESEDPSLRSSQVKIGRFADLAGEQMRRLRRNWTTTKTDIGKSITRIKKKSTASVADLSEVFKPSTSRREVSPDKSNNKEPIYSPSSPTCPSIAEVRPNSGDQKKKGTWAMRQIRRRMTIVSPTYGVTGNKEKASTFYLTLTIEQPTTPVKYVLLPSPH